MTVLQLPAVDVFNGGSTMETCLLCAARFDELAQALRPGCPTAGFAGGASCPRCGNTAPHEGLGLARAFRKLLGLVRRNK
jgi:hypothetical protein